MKKITAVWLLAFIILVGIGLRSWELTARSLWFDEAFSWRLIQFPWATMIERAAADVHPPLYYIVLKTWGTIFGTSLFALRFFSVLAAGATLALAYLFTAYAFRTRAAGLLAAALLALAGFQIQFAQEARMYTLGTALALLSSWLLLHALRARPERLSWWLGYGVATAAFAGIHYYALFSIAAQVLFIIVYLCIATRGRIGEILQWRLTWYTGLAGIVSLSLYAIWIPTFLRQNAQVQDAYWIPKIGGWSIPDTAYRMLMPTPGIPPHQGALAITVALLPLAAVLLGWLLLGLTDRNPQRRSRDASWLVVLSGLIPFLCSIGVSLFTQSLYQDRFFVFAHVYIIIGLAALLWRVRPRPLALGLIIVTLAGFGAATYLFWQELNITARPGAHAAARAVFSERQESEAVVVSSPFVFFAIDHYAQEEFMSRGVPKLYTEDSNLLHFAGGPILKEEDIVGPVVFQAADPSSLWVVDTTGFGGVPLVLPSPWVKVSQQNFLEVFGYQGEVIVSRYRRQ
ncbi:MAG: glycosyltransferase family 39 protein [Candidatus Andersenbacteria bacterium]